MAFDGDEVEEGYERGYEVEVEGEGEGEEEEAAEEDEELEQPRGPDWYGDPEIDDVFDAIINEPVRPRSLYVPPHVADGDDNDSSSAPSEVIGGFAAQATGPGPDPMYIDASTNTEPEGNADAEGNAEAEGDADVEGNAEADADADANSSRDSDVMIIEATSSAPPPKPSKSTSSRPSSSSLTKNFAALILDDDEVVRAEHVLRCVLNRRMLPDAGNYLVDAREEGRRRRWFESYAEAKASGREIPPWRHRAPVDIFAAGGPPGWRDMPTETVWDRLLFMFVLTHWRFFQLRELEP
ncbi:hypothetical protein F5Y08DRAFT_302364 [Xylaria arbuscula]|nr:hypothetical protein F5Y08DRAFT_302364 [Xylaria arbuscula]